MTYYSRVMNPPARWRPISLPGVTVTGCCVYFVVLGFRKHAPTFALPFLRYVGVWIHFAVCKVLMTKYAPSSCGGARLCLISWGQLPVFLDAVESQYFTLKRLPILHRESDRRWYDFQHSSFFTDLKDCSRSTCINISSDQRIYLHFETRRCFEI